MVHSRGSSSGGRRPRPVGVRTAWRVVADGEFFCPDCGGDRCYQQLSGRRRLRVVGVPVLPRGEAEPVVECSYCHGRFPLSALDVPTTTRLTALLRDAVHTVAIAVLAAGGAERRAVREAAVDEVRAAGFADCTEERLLTLLAALTSEGQAAIAMELRVALHALTPQLSAGGREGLLLRGARIALADGPYGAAESEMLAVTGAALGLAPTDTERLLTAARAGSSNR
ncbi:hypothetical protein [Streptomyces aidingensis]|uniref:Tellurite resistance protein TerB n=1 Tax=Streptomyces aidingensis TaxID=910347 RepID=A0A1I1FN74_9ACTN|nr:hypothetical protein [Streptomyces aidingensis]SFC00989.1 hypothetical protein SAMN05421773_101811 [Streptomyces aidingensis]